MLKNKKYIISCSLIVFSLLLSSCMFSSKKPEDKKPFSDQYKEEPIISLYVKETGEIKKIKLEEYIKGVVAAEMDSKWEAEALTAQAILARTFTLKKIEQGGVKERGTDASTDIEEFQAYDPKKINSAVSQVVEKTRGKVITYNGKYILAWFFADGGGRTAASADEGLGFKKEPTPYIHSVKDPGLAITVPENKSWTAILPLNTVQKAVQEVGGKGIANLKNASIVEKGPSGRATKVKINNIDLSAPALRLALGNDKMRSTLIDTFIVNNNKLVIHGKGYGHGVGMSQWGARALAKNGKKAEEIVNYFFKDIEIKQIYK